MQRSSKFWKIVAHMIFIIILTDVIVKRSMKVMKTKKIRRFLPDIRHILLWHKINIEGIEDNGQDMFVSQKCEHTNCYITSNRSLFGNLGYFDAVLFNAIDVSAGSWDLPDVRTPIQKYVFVANESSDNYPVCDSVYDSFFNWTWTYKLDSTIPYTYFTVHNKNDENLGSYFRWVINMTDISDYLKGQLATKSKAAAIFLDKCKSRSKREVYIDNLIKELAKYNLSIDIYGDCGPKKCKRRNMSGCFWRLRQQYYFYLAMEDSIAANYITSEVAYAYENNAVPIVYGGAQYSGFLPPNSYMNAIQLNEAMLASLMNSIIKNRTLYHDYFRWRNHYIIRSTKDINPLNPCELCKALSNPQWLNFKTRNREFRKWWNPFYKDRCLE